MNIYASSTYDVEILTNQIIRQKRPNQMFLGGLINELGCDTRLSLYIGQVCYTYQLECLIKKNERPYIIKHDSFHTSETQRLGLINLYNLINYINVLNQARLHLRNNPFWFGWPNGRVMYLEVKDLKFKSHQYGQV